MEICGGWGIFRGFFGSGWGSGGDFFLFRDFFVIFVGIFIAVVVVAGGFSIIVVVVFVVVVVVVVRVEIVVVGVIVVTINRECFFKCCCDCVLEFTCTFHH